MNDKHAKMSSGTARTAASPRHGSDVGLNLLPQETIKTIGRFEFLARTPKIGFVTGKHRSPNKGFSVEFAEHRAYAAGDDLRDLDWRVYARSDRLYVKEFVEETNMRATILIDCSGSMRYAGTQASRDPDGKPMSKFDYARRLAASLSYLLINQQDAVGTVCFDSKIRSFLPARARPSQLKAILDDLGDMAAGGETALSAIFDEIAERIPRSGLVLIVSDFFDDPRAISKALHHFKYRRNEIVVFHVLANEELTFPFDAFSEFADLEDDANVIPVDPRALRADYIDQVGQFIHALETECGRLSIDYVPMNTMRPDALALAEYLQARRATRQ